jgi:hypothetical protein
MAYSSAVAVKERGPPTLWPPGPGEWTYLRCAVEACELENRVLKILVIDLSEVVLGL